MTFIPWHASPFSFPAFSNLREFPLFAPATASSGPRSRPKAPPAHAQPTLRALSGPRAPRDSSGATEVRAFLRRRMHRRGQLLPALPLGPAGEFVQRTSLFRNHTACSVLLLQDLPCVVFVLAFCFGMQMYLTCAYILI